MWRSVSTALAALVAAMVLVVAYAPGTAHGSHRFPEWARSALVLRASTARMGPYEDAEPRGVIQKDTRVRIDGAIVATEDPCRFYLNVGVDAWVCGRHLQASEDEPWGDEQPRLRGEHQVVPYLYAQVNRGGAPAWSRRGDVDRASPSRTIRGGWMLATVGGRNRTLVQTADSEWLRADDVTFYYPSRFEGVDLEPGRDLSSVAWVVKLRANVYPAIGERRSDRLRHLTQIDVRESDHEGYYELLDGRGYVEVEDVARIRPAAPPPELRPGERWIDVDLDTQTLVAYEGRRPMFATLISSGRQRWDYVTPVGTFRIWSKYAMSRMDDIGNQDSSRDYSADAVPWVQFFDGSIGFHAAYWHNSFGQRMSHGCVNLSPMDARRLFGMTTPRLDDGWVSVRPSPSQMGTLVRVREDGERPVRPAD